MGEKTILKAIGDNSYWIIPKKFGCSAGEELQRIRLNQYKSLAKTGVREIITKAKELHPEIENEADLLKTLSIEEQDQVVFATSDSVVKSPILYRIYLLNGIAKHNFVEDEESDKMTEEMVDIILQNSELTEELFAIIEKKNPFYLSQQASEVK
jgi:hypothetical protein